MAKQKGHLKITGTMGDVTYYYCRGHYWARKKSSLDAARINEDPAFAGLLKEAGVLQQASPLASAVYRQFTVKKKRQHYFQLTGQAQRLLREGVAVSRINELLFEYAAKEWGFIK
jgi:hypothetical protein